MALKVTNLAKSKMFYQNLFAMKVVWHPDEENLYLSSGVDNLALHQIPASELQQYQQDQGQFLDHFGFLMESAESVDQLYHRVQEQGATILHPPKQHRDGSYSFYLSDPDHITIQVLYEPSISGIRHKA